MTPGVIPNPRVRLVRCIFIFDVSAEVTRYKRRPTAKRSSNHREKYAQKPLFYEQASFLYEAWKFHWILKTQIFNFELSFEISYFIFFLNIIFSSWILFSAIALAYPRRILDFIFPNQKNIYFMHYIFLCFYVLHVFFI